jgi:hypothetical protein
MKYIITESKLESVALNMLNKYYGDLRPETLEDMEETIFYVKDNETDLSFGNDIGPIIEYNPERNSVGIYTNVWKLLRNMLGMDYKESKKIIILWLKETYNITADPNEMFGI